jgi:hypothetical protein
MYRRIILINRMVVLRCCSPPFPSRQTVVATVSVGDLPLHGNYSGRSETVFMAPAGKRMPTQGQKSEFSSAAVTPPILLKPLLRCRAISWTSRSEGRSPFDAV